MRFLLFFFFFWGRTILLWTSLWELLLLHPIDFVILCFHFPLSQGIFQFLLRFHFWLISFLVACCLASTYLFFSHFSFCNWFLVSLCCDWKKMLHITSFLLNLLRLDFWPGIRSILENTSCALEKQMYFAVFVCNILMISIISNRSIVSYKTTVALLAIYQDDLSIV